MLQYLMTTFYIYIYIYIDQSNTENDISSQTFSHRLSSEIIAENSLSTANKIAKIKGKKDNRHYNNFYSKPPYVI